MVIISTSENRSYIKERRIFFFIKKFSSYAEIDEYFSPLCV